MRRGFLFLTFTILLLVVVERVASAPQGRPGGTATITGIVIGPDDRPVPNASVTYQSSGGSAPHAVHTDAHGRFRLSKLRADSYDLRATSKGVFSEWVKNLPLRRGETKSVTLNLIYAKTMPKAKPPAYGRPQSGGSL